ncbi:MAG: GNAT family N-acetyltransferase [Myxococcota bacterium]|nr:GNAT family N-acetyltransferase [Myxococcales bacterium]
MEISHDLDGHLDLLVEMEIAAAEAYLRFVYDDWEHARRIQRFLGEKGLLESSAPWGRVMMHEGHAIGAVSGIPGAELRKLRMRAAFALAKEPALRPDPPTQRRIKLAADALVAARDDDFYSSKLAVTERARGTGAGPALMDYVTEEARRGGFARIVGEVSAANERMLHVMCDKVGWDRIGEGSATCPDSGRSVTFVHVGRLFR